MSPWRSGSLSVWLGDWVNADNWDDRFSRVTSSKTSNGKSVDDGVDFSETMTCERFGEIDNDIFMNTLGPVKQVMGDVGLKFFNVGRDTLEMEVNKVSTELGEISSVFDQMES